MAEKSKDRYLAVQESIAKTAKNCGRKPEDITLVAVSKKKKSEDILELASLGHRVFGESYVQEMQEKYRFLKDHNFQWHFIGHLQTNKVKYIIDKVSLIHSVDRFKLAKEINRRAEAIGRKIDILLQVNLAGEKTKSGTLSSEVESLIVEVGKLKNIRITGLMSMPPFFQNPEQVRPFFNQLRCLRDSLIHLGYSLPELSMGMSNDFPVAISEGATLIRVGTSLFGPRE